MPKPGEFLLSALEKIPIQLLPESQRYLCRAGDKAAPKRHTEARHKVGAQALTEAGGRGGKPSLAPWELRVSPGSAEPGSCPSPRSAPAPASTSAPPWKSRHRHPQAARGPGRPPPGRAPGGAAQSPPPRHPLQCSPSSQPPLSPGAWSPWQLQQDRAPFPHCVRGRVAQMEPKASCLWAATSGDPGGKRLQAWHGQEQQQWENAPELFHFPGNPGPGSMCGRQRPERGAGPAAAGKGAQQQGRAGRQRPAQGKVCCGCSRRASDP